MEIDNGIKRNNKLIILITAILVIITILLTLALYTDNTHKDFDHTGPNISDMDINGTTLTIVIWLIVSPINGVVICLFKWNNTN